MTVVDAGLDELLASPEFITDPYPVFRRLREESPVHWVERWGCWLLTRAEDIELTIRDTRRFSSAQRVTRVITKDAEISGVTLRAGDLVRQTLGSADRDPARFDDPDVFGIERPPARPLSFGRGHHFCLGAPLAPTPGTDRGRRCSGGSPACA
jgi:cytochrome P450